MKRGAWIGILAVLVLGACATARAGGDKWLDPAVTHGRVTINGEVVEFDKEGAVVQLVGSCNYDWWYGCSPTSAGMLMGYYDRKLTWGGLTYYNLAPGGMAETNSYGGGGGLDWNNDPNPDLVCNKAIASSGHIADFWGADAPQPWHQFDSLSDFMGTSMDHYGNGDGSTTWWYRTDGQKTYPSNIITWGNVGNSGMYGMWDYADYRGYGSGNPNTDTNFFNQRTDNMSVNGFTFAEYKAEIDAGRPVVVHVYGHSMLGYGYDDGIDRLYVYDTWKPNGQNPGYFTWGGTYDDRELRGVTCAKMTGGKPLMVLRRPPRWWWVTHPMTFSLRWDLRNPQWDPAPYMELAPEMPLPMKGEDEGKQGGRFTAEMQGLTYTDEDGGGWGVEGDGQSGGSGIISIDVDNVADPTMIKEVFLQFRMQIEGDANCGTGLYAPGDITGGEMDLVGSDGDWGVYEVWWQIRPQPGYEQIILSLTAGPNGAVWIQNIDVGTYCPEPATVGLLALGALALLSRRRRRRAA
ncbi:MAG: C39 family peptidase [Phycisphaerae bacterium]